MEIKFIGTGSSRTSLKRFHSSFIILTEKFNLLIDAGDGISKALLQNKISFDEIDGILFTHLHPDHFSGLGTLIIQMKLKGRTKKLKIYIHEGLSKSVRDFLFNSFLFEERMDFQICYEVFKHNQRVNINGKIKFISRQNSHLDQYVKYDKGKKLNFISSAILFELNNKKLCYTGDVGSANDLFLFEDYKIQKMISETTHVNTADLLSAFNKLGLKEMYLTHISDDEESSLNQWKSSLPDEIRTKFIIACDGMSVEI